MKLLLIALSALLLSSATVAESLASGHAESEVGATLADRIGDILEPEASAGRFAGIALVAKQGKVLFEKAYGMADVEVQRPNDADTRFLIYSTTKQLTASLTMKLVAQKRIALDDSVRKYIPEAPESWQPVTIHHLLTHTSGIPDHLEDLLTHYDGNDQSTLIAVINDLEQTDLDSPPGETWRYSNFGYQVLEVALERATGTPYPELLEEDIFSAAGMADSGTIAPANPTGDPPGCAPVAHLARGYNGTPDKLEPATSLMYVNLGAGGVYTTADDLLRYDNLLREGKFLDCETQRIMLDRGVPVRDGVTYGYGWIIRQPKDGVYSFEHSGGNNGYTSQYIRVPRTGLCIVLLSNRGFAPVGDLGKAILELLLAEP